MLGKKKETNISTVSEGISRKVVRSFWEEIGTPLMALIKLSSYEVGIFRIATMSVVISVPPHII